MKEKQALEERNMAVIERVYQRMRENEEVRGASGRYRRIRGCGLWRERHERK